MRTKLERIRPLLMLYQEKIKKYAKWIIYLIEYLNSICKLINNRILLIKKRNYFLLSSNFHFICFHLPLLVINHEYLLYL